jgi:hypothetical protein
MTLRMDTQCNAILAALQSGRKLSPMEALREFGCFRLGARIWDLKQAGHPIERTWGTDGEKRWAEYRLQEAVRE